MEKMWRSPFLFLALVLVVHLSLILAEEEDDKKSVGTVIGIDLGTTYSW